MVTREEYVENVKLITILDSKIYCSLTCSENTTQEFIKDILKQRSEIDLNMKNQMRSFGLGDRILLTATYLKYKRNTRRISKEISKYILRNYNLD